MRTIESYIGEFETSGKLIVTDPCYDKVDETDQLQAVINVLPGVWEAQIEISKEGGWGKRVKTLTAWASSYGPWTHNSYGYGHNWEYLNNCGVDSGQLGIFDWEKYPGKTGDYVEGTWYKKACDLTYSEKEKRFAGIMEGMGINSSSGYGDGGYNCYVSRNSSGDIVGIEVRFIDDPEEEDYYDFGEGC